MNDIDLYVLVILLLKAVYLMRELMVDHACFYIFFPGIHSTYMWTTKSICNSVFRDVRRAESF